MPETRKCALCGAAPATTREHIPPESFFERPYPENLITVPSCEACNLGTQRDDEYALSYLVSRDFPGGSPTLEKVRDRVHRSLSRPQRPGLRQRLRDATEVRTTTDPKTGDTYIALATRPEGRRMLTVLRKQVRGIVYHVTHVIVPRSTFIVAERIYGNAVAPTADADMWAAAAAEALRGEVDSRGDAFRFAYKSISKSACVAVVYLEYWQLYGYAALVFHPDFAPPQRVHLPFQRKRPANPS
jgi:hypothetical protein